jgi:hypothetical protein
LKLARFRPAQTATDQKKSSKFLPKARGIIARFSRDFAMEHWEETQ